MQSRRTWLLELSAPVPMNQVTSGASSGGSGVVLADPSGAPLRRDVTTVVVGPEGGFTTDELSCGAVLASLSAQILRVETAALAAAAQLCAS
jgi:RsmE family RNA methyltransferase